ncbi:MAG: site-2 protease family protein, partial [bacterium]
MVGEFQLGRIHGIPVKVHWTLLLFMPVLAWLFAAQLDDVRGTLPFFELDPAPLETPAGRLFTGFVVVVGLFVSVLLHELGHAVVALRHKVGVKQITLWIFGGIALLEGITRDPKAEAKIAAAGPAVSFALGLMPAAFLLVEPGDYVRFVVVYLANLNVVLALFNLVPAFPLDGGRLLRAALATRMPFGRATRISADIGKGLAVVMGLGGLLVGAVFLILIALFIYMGASQEAQGVELFDALEGVSVAEIMDVHVPSVQSADNLDGLVRLMLSTRTTGFPVVDDGSVVGIVTLSDLQEVPESSRPLLHVRDAMTRDLVVVSPEARASAALRLMVEHEIGRLLVVRDGRLAGVVTRTGIMHAFEILRILPRGEAEELPE